MSREAADVKPQLVMDAAGVLVTNFSPFFWRKMEAAQGGEMERGALKQRFKREVRERLWSGGMTEEAFWAWLAEQCPAVETKDARAWLSDLLQPLPALRHVKAWSRYADVHLLSNHRSEWIISLLEPIRPYTKSMTISSEAGLCKPDFRIFELAESRMAGGRTVLYVDDQAKNLAPASRMGWKTLLADKEGKWMELLTGYLRQTEEGTKEETERG